MCTTTEASTRCNQVLIPGIEKYSHAFKVVHRADDSSCLVCSSLLDAICLVEARRGGAHETLERLESNA